MDRFSHRKIVSLGYRPHRPFTNPIDSSPTAPFTSSDVDFDDVFGGPPRRHERYSLNEATDSYALRREEETSLHSRRWSGLGEKPVFGEGSVNQRKYPSHDFFDDIFRGDESLILTPRKIDQGPFSSAPGSRVLSPARPLPFRAEPFGISSLPSEFSLPAKLSKEMDLPAFASVSRSPSRDKDVASSGIISPYSPSASMSRFSSQAIQCQDEWRNEIRPSYRQSPLSHECSLSKQESAKVTKSNKTDTGGNLKKESNSSNIPATSGQFHFSIYKWASKGVPLMMPLRGGNSSKLKEKNIERCSSSNGKAKDDNRVTKLPTETLSDIEFPVLDNSVSSNTMSYRTECKKQDNEALLITSTGTQDKLEPCQAVEEAVLAIAESEPPKSLQSTVEDTFGNTISDNTREDTKPHSLPDKGLYGHIEEKISVSTKEASKTELKPLHAFLYDNNDGQGKDEKTKEAGKKENMVKITKKSSGSVNAGKSVKKQDGKKGILNGAEVDKASLQGSPINTGNDIGRNKVRGKVKEFVKIFNQEVPSKPTINVHSRSRSSIWTGAGIFRAENVASVSTNRSGEKMQMPNVDKKKTSTNASVKADEYCEQSEKQESDIETTTHIFSDSSSGQKDSASSSSVSIPDGSKSTFGNIDDSFEGNFVLEELPQDQNKLLQTGKDRDEFQVSDAKIRQWSNGKEGNIRSLLSTLQYVLWPQSGWKAVALVDIIEGNAVKRAYQKALLCLHPDKLQQKGAAAHEKYIAEKVFDILQEAWTHFNLLGGSL